MNKSSKLLLLAIFSFFCSAGSNAQEKENSESLIQVVRKDKEQRVDILVDGKLFTSYLYTDTIPDLKKTVLFPIYSAKGSVITRGYPLNPRSGERTDHPHHIGMWLNYGNVNNIDFWGYSDAIPLKDRGRMGTIRHKLIKQVKSGEGSGELEVEMEWLNSDNYVLLKEDTKFVFKAGENYRIIDRITTLTANTEKVNFEDTKEGMMAIRVNRALELPSDRPVVLSDDHGNKTEVAKLDNTGVTGKYLNSEGISGLDVWGKRASWVSLSGRIGDEDVSIIIFAHPENVGSPSYWHARGYGLFAVNPLGQKTFTKGEQELNLSLKPGESVTFKYRVLIQSGKISSDEIQTQYDKYVGAQETIIIGHRGASSVAPENTLASFRAAIEMGADYFELDVRASKDDSLMVIHDGKIDRTTNGTGSFHDFTYEQLRSYDAGSWFAQEFAEEKIPTLREALQLAIDNNVKVCVEIKDYDKTPQIIELIKKMNAEESVIIFCFDFDAISTAKRMDENLSVCYLQGLITRKHIQRLKSIGGEVVGTGGLASENLINYAHTQGIECWKWTVNSIGDMKTLIARGIDGIITNYPQRLMLLTD